MAHPRHAVSRIYPDQVTGKGPFLPCKTSAFQRCLQQRKHPRPSGLWRCSRSLVIGCPVAPGWIFLWTPALRKKLAWKPETVSLKTAACQGEAPPERTCSQRATPPGRTNGRGATPGQRRGSSWWQTRSWSRPWRSPCTCHAGTRESVPRPPRRSWPRRQKPCRRATASSW